MTTDQLNAAIYKAKHSCSYVCTFWSRRRISRSWVSTLKADFSALQWTQLSLHHTEGMLLQNAKERLACMIDIFYVE